MDSEPYDLPETETNARPIREPTRAPNNSRNLTPVAGHPYWSIWAAQTLNPDRLYPRLWAGGVSVSEVEMLVGLCLGGWAVACRELLLELRISWPYWRAKIRW